jgi:hypothetical protein
MSNPYFAMIQPNIDSFGVITQNAKQNWDGGDTTQRCAMFMCAMQYHLEAGRITQTQFNEMATRYMGIINNLLYRKIWSLRRHPDPTKWYHDPNRMSRDQLTSNICALGFASKWTLFKLLLGNILRGMLFTTNTRENGATKSNGQPISFLQRIQYFFGWRPAYPVWAWSLPDVTDPSIWGAYIRGLSAWPLYPLLFLTDLVLVIQSLITLYETDNGTASDDQLTQQMLLLQSNYRLKTPVSMLAMWLYKKANPMAALNAYFAPANDGPAMNKVYTEIWADQ